MIVRETYKGSAWEIFQADDDYKIKIYKDGVLVRTVTAKGILDASQLLQILHLYQLE